MTPNVDWTRIWESTDQTTATTTTTTPTTTTSVRPGRDENATTTTTAATTKHFHRAKHLDACLWCNDAAATDNNDDGVVDALPLHCIWWCALKTAAAAAAAIKKSSSSSSLPREIHDHRRGWGADDVARVWWWHPLSKYRPISCFSTHKHECNTHWFRCSSNHTYIMRMNKNKRTRYTEWKNECGYHSSSHTIIIIIIITLLHTHSHS